LCKAFVYHISELEPWKVFEYVRYVIGVTEDELDTRVMNT
jgi:hypothetical protein